MARTRAIARNMTRTIARAMTRGPFLGDNLAGSGYTLSVNGGAGTATESPTGQLNLTGDGTNLSSADKSFTTIVGRRYRITHNVATNTCGLSAGTSQSGQQVITGFTQAVGFNSVEFTATATLTWLRFFKSAAALSVITGIEVREIPAA